MPGITGIPEITGFHPISKDDQHENNIGVKFGDYTIIGLLKDPRIEGCQQQVIHQPGQYDSQPVDGGLPEQLFDGIFQYFVKVTLSAG